MFLLDLKKVSLVKYIMYKNIQIEYGKPFYKTVACLHDVIFILQHFDWVLCIISERDWINNFQSRDITIVKKKFEKETVKTPTKCSHNLWVIKMNKKTEIYSVCWTKDVI